MLSGQQPYGELKQQPSPFWPCAGVFLSLQHPNGSLSHGEQSAPAHLPGLAVVVVVFPAAAFCFFVGFGVVVVVVVVIIGQPSLFSPSASVLPSEQQPNKLLVHSGSGHPLYFLPLAGDTPSSQQPYLVSLHVSGRAQPSSNGPVEAVLLSGQQPNSLARQADGLAFRSLHCRGFCSLVIIASNAFGVVDQISSSVVLNSTLDVLDQISVVDSISLGLVDDTASVLDDTSVDCSCSVLLDSLDILDRSNDSLVLVSVVLCSATTLDSVDISAEVDSV